MKYIYLLKDPITQEVRYIGQSDDAEKRFKAHLFVNGDTRKDEWLTGLKLTGYLPILEIIEEVEDKKAYEREIYWIQQYKSGQLLNIQENTLFRYDGWKTTSVKINKKIYEKFKLLSIENEITLQTLVNICLDFYGNNENFRDLIVAHHNYKNFKLDCLEFSGSLSR